MLLSLSLAAQDSPWSPGKNHGYAQFVFNTLPPYTSIFNGSEVSRESERVISELTISSFTEIGITKNFTLGATIPLINTSTGEPGINTPNPSLPADNLTSLGNVSLSAKYTFGNTPIKIAFIPKVDFPTSNRSDVSGLSTGVDAFTFRPGASIGNSGSNWFYYGFFGYGFRSNEHNDFLNYGIEGGKKLDDRLSIILNVNRLQNINNGNPLVDSPANLETGLYTSFQEYTAFIFKFFVEDLYKDYGAFVSFGGAVSADSVAASPAISLGVFKKW